MNCTSNSTDYGAQQRRAYEQGQQAGSAFGQGLSLAMQAHSFNKGVSKYCAAHPGEEWTYRNNQNGNILSSGHCPSLEERGSIAANLFMSKHKEFVACPENSKAMTDWLEAKNLNPLEEKSFERAFKELKMSGQLKLYAK